MILCITQGYAGKSTKNDPYFDDLSFARIMWNISQGRGVSAEDEEYVQQVIFTQPCAQWVLRQENSSPTSNTTGESWTILSETQQFETKLETPLESCLSNEETEFTPSIPAQLRDVPPLPDTIVLDYEHKDACFETFECRGNSKLIEIRDAIQLFSKENLKSKGSRILYLWGPAGSGKTHCLVSAMRCFSTLGNPIEFLKGDQINNSYYKRVGYGATLENFIEVLGPNIFIDDLNSTNTLIMQFLKILVLSAFDKGGKKIIITSNMEPDTFISSLTLENRFYGNSLIFESVRSKEADRLLRRFGAMAQIISFNGIPTRRHNWLDERYDNVGGVD